MFGVLYTLQGRNSRIFFFFQVSYSTKKVVIITLWRWTRRENGPNPLSNQARPNCDVQYVRRTGSTKECPVDTPPPPDIKIFL